MVWCKKCGTDHKRVDNGKCNHKVDAESGVCLSKSCGEYYAMEGDKYGNPINNA